MTQINDTPLQRTPPAVFDYEDDLRSVHVKKKHSMIVPLENKIKQIQRKQWKSFNYSLYQFSES